MFILKLFEEVESIFTLFGDHFDFGDMFDLRNDVGN
jgi:hypothetical protein